MNDPGEFTTLLRESRQGRREAFDRLMPLVYGSLRRLAANALRGERDGHTLTPTALANEAYLKLAALERIEWRDRAHFFAVAAGAMRRILVNHAEARRARKRGGGAAAVALEDAALVSEDRIEDLLAIDRALDRLQALSPAAARVVECRIFMGMTVEETAAAMDCSAASVKRHWTTARAWLTRELTGAPHDE